MTTDSPCPLGCGLRGLHSTLDCATRRGVAWEGDAGGACAALRRENARLREAEGAAWARGFDTGLAQGTRRAEQAEARTQTLWLALRQIASVCTPPGEGEDRSAEDAVGAALNLARAALHPEEKQ